MVSHARRHKPQRGGKVVSVMITKENACVIGCFNARVVSPFKARWVNVGYKNGEMVDVVTEREYSVGELVYCNEWRPEGMKVNREGDEFPMFVFWENFKNLEIVNG